MAKDITCVMALIDGPSSPGRIAVRTYALALSFSLGPGVLSLLIALLRLSNRQPPRNAVLIFRRLLQRELGFHGFAFCVTLAVAGGAALKAMWDLVDSCCIPRKPQADQQSTYKSWQIVLGLRSPTLRLFISNMISSAAGITLLQNATEANTGSRSKQQMRRMSRTIDFTILVAVRALDSLIQNFLFKNLPHRANEGYDKEGRERRTAHRLQPTVIDHTLIRERLEREENNKKIQEQGRRVKFLRDTFDGVVFWACSARIMWCFFYQPQRLPESYVKWISALANVDTRLVETLRRMREGTWKYGVRSLMHGELLTSYSRDLGHPELWGDPIAVPTAGGYSANQVWHKLGVKGRDCVGGVPCELVHGKVGLPLGLQGSCATNAGLRAIIAFSEALLIYLPAHALPILLTRPKSMLRVRRLASILMGATRSATFLSAFISLYWYSVCFTRTIVLARLFPSVSHNFWDGPYGCILAGCLMCGSSIWIESGKRRGEMALYVLPKAIKTCLPYQWLPKGKAGVKVAERLTFTLAMSCLLTAAWVYPDSLRGLSRWSLSFMINGSDSGFWRWKRLADPSIPATPAAATGTPIDTHRTPTDSVKPKQ